MLYVLAQIWPCLLAAFGLGSALALLLRNLFRQPEIPTVDLSQYVRRSDLPALPDLSGYARKSDLPGHAGRVPVS